MASNWAVRMAQRRLAAVRRQRAEPEGVEDLQD